MLSIIADSLAADVGLGPTAQLEQAGRCDANGLESRDLTQQHLADRRVLVAQVDIDAGGLDRMGGDQGTFEEAMRVAADSSGP